MEKKRIIVKQSKDLYGYTTYEIIDYETGELLRWGIYLFTLNEWIRENNAMVMEGK